MIVAEAILFVVLGALCLALGIRFVVRGDEISRYSGEQRIFSQDRPGPTSHMVRVRGGMLTVLGAMAILAAALLAFGAR